MPQGTGFSRTTLKYLAVYCRREAQVPYSSGAVSLASRLSRVQKRSRQRNWVCLRRDCNANCRAAAKVAAGIMLAGFEPKPACGLLQQRLRCSRPAIHYVAFLALALPRRVIILCSHIADSSLSRNLNFFPTLKMSRDGVHRAWWPMSLFMTDGRAVEKKCRALFSPFA